MADLLIRNLDEETIKALKRQAKMNGRSLQSEIKSVLEEAAKLDLEASLALVKRIRRKFKGRRFKDSVDLIREGRKR